MTVPLANIKKSSVSCMGFKLRLRSPGSSLSPYHGAMQLHEYKLLLVSSKVTGGEIEDGEYCETGMDIQLHERTILYVF